MNLTEKKELNNSQENSVSTLFPEHMLQKITENWQKQKMPKRGTNTQMLI